MKSIAFPGEQLHSVRLFPKFKGADAYRVTGIAARCDWVVLSDDHPPFVHVRRNGIRDPETIFLSLRSPFRALKVFHDEILPTIPGRFVLVTGSEDITIPHQTDARWPRFDKDHRRLIERIRRDSRLVQWFTENLDSRTAGLTPIPTGVVPPPSATRIECLPPYPEPDPRSVLCAHRVRSGDQWAMRRSLLEMCRNSGGPNCTILERELPFSSFSHVLRGHAFVLCVEGGGLDPSPKAWIAMQQGCIPIVRESPTTDAYRDLPVAFTPRWDSRVVDPAWLEARYGELRRWFRSDKGRVLLRQRLSLGYWWGKIIDGVAAPRRLDLG
ncbi:MAG: hypothetical protein ACNS61_16090 [Candidatus Wenzhouxiangella sp. M2_3B_020]